MRNHTAKSSGIISPSPVVLCLHRTPTQTRAASPKTSVLLVSLAGVFGLAGLVGAAPCALAAEPNGLPQAYSAKIVDTASLTTSATLATAAPGASSATASSATASSATGSSANVAPVVSMLPVPKADPAAVTVPKVTKRKAKKVIPTTPGAPALSQEALALPTSKLQLSKTPQDLSRVRTPDTKAPVEIVKENSTTSTNSTNSSLDAAFAALRKCESGGNYKTATGNGYYGAYQFDPRTWRALGYPGLPSDAPPEVQDEAARKLLAKAGWGQWPACSRKLGLR